MYYLLLIVHVATAIIFIGGVSVSTSLFPRYATGEAAARYAEHGGNPAALAMHRITFFYGRLSLITPVVGLLLAFVVGRAGELWILLSILLVAAAGALLMLRIVPLQRAMLAAPPTDPRTRGRAMGYAGLLNLIWVAILVLMFVQPGSLH